MFDCINALFLTIAYAAKGDVAFKEGLIFGGIGGIGLVVGMIFQKKFLTKFSYLLKGSLGWVLIVISFIFFIRGIMLWRKDKAEREIYYVETSESDSINSDTASSEKKEEWRPKEKSSWFLLMLLLALISLISGGMAGTIGKSCGSAGKRNGRRFVSSIDDAVSQEPVEPEQCGYKRPAGIEDRYRSADSKSY